MIPFGIGFVLRYLHISFYCIYFYYFFKEILYIP